MPQNETPAVSVVIAMRDEAQLVDELLGRLDAALSGAGRAFEVVAVDDGSTDDTWERLKRCAPSRPWLRGIALARAFGQHAATFAGLRAARGGVIVTMDADLEVDPEDTQVLLAQIDDGADVVFAERAHAQEGFVGHSIRCAAKRFLSRHAVGAPPAKLSTFLAARREVVEAALEFENPRPVTPYHLMLAGPRDVRSVTVRERPRAKGSSKYNALRLVRLSADVFFGYATIVEETLAALAAAVPAGTLLLWVAAFFFSLGGLEWASGFLVLAGIIYALAGLSALVLFVGELALRRGGKGKPLYLVRETL